MATGGGGCVAAAADAISGNVSMSRCRSWIARIATSDESQTFCATGVLRSAPQLRHHPSSSDAEAAARTGAPIHQM